MVIETLEKRLAMTAIVDASIASRDLRTMGSYTQAAANWFWRAQQPVATPSGGGSISTSMLRAADASLSNATMSGNWIVRLKSESLAGINTGADLARLLDPTGVGIEVLSGLGLPGQVLVRGVNPTLNLGEFLGRHSSIASFQAEDVVWADNTLPTPNDPDYGRLYGLNNLGQTGGRVDADIDAPEAWAISTGSRNNVVSVIDTGIDLAHRDLYQNIWISQTEIPTEIRSRLADTDRDGRITFIDLNQTANATFVMDANRNGYVDGLDLLADSRWANGSDTDGNGFVDDLFGWDFVNNDNNPFDDHGHGTHVAGTIGAMANNATGVVGVSWNVSLMALKFLSAGGSGSTSAAIQAVNYATMIRTRFDSGVRITNNSWGGGGYSQPLKDAIDAGGNAGILFVASASNWGRDSDVSPSYPAAYSSAAIVSVASTDHADALSPFSNYGATSVDIGAPGSAIYSTLPGDRYGTYNGTSMASPHVAGAAALALASRPSLSVADLKQALLRTVDPLPGLAGRTVSGGRLNAARLLAELRGGSLALLGNRVAENAPAGTQVGLLSVNGGVAGQSFTYALVGGDAQSFVISGDRLLTNQVFDFERRSSYSIRVRATDQAGATIESVFAVTVTNVNEAPTRVNFVNPATVIPENTNLSSRVRVAAIQVIDDALGSNLLRVSGADASAFEIQGTDLFLKAGVSLDRVRKPQYSVQVVASDSTAVGPSVAGTIRLTVIAPVSPATLVFGAPGTAYRGLIPNYFLRAGDSVTQTLGAAPFAAAERLSLTLQYFASGTAGATMDLGVFANGVDVGRFTVAMGTSGAATREFAFPAIAGPAYRIEVRALSGASTGQGVIMFAANGLSRATLVAANRQPTDISLSGAAIPENRPQGSVVGSLSTADADMQETFTYALVPGEGSEGNQHFAIDGDRIVTTASLDYEASREHSVRVRSTDRGGLSVEKTFRISVLDANEAPTAVRLEEPVAMLPEDADTAGRIKLANIVVVDDATGTNVFSLTGADSESFEVIGTALYLKAGVALDFETKPQYAIQVVAQDPTLDGGAPVSADFVLEIEDVAEWKRELRFAPGWVMENSLVGSAVGFLDAGAGPAGSFELVAGEGDLDNGDFYLSGRTLHVQQRIDFEAKPSRSIRVRFTDEAGQVSEEPILIAVKDVNEHPTAIALSRGTINENNAVGDIVGSLSTADPDANNTHTYSLVAGPGSFDNAAFAIVGGELRAAQSYNFEMRRTYLVRVRSTDQGGLFWDQILTVAVGDVNEAPTSISLSTSSVPENAPAGMVVGMLRALDPDRGATHSFSLVSGDGATDNAAFTIVGNLLRTNVRMDFEKQPTYAIRVRATDAMGLSVERQLVIAVRDVNEAPVNTVLSATTIAENNDVGALVGRFQTTDPDANSRHTYSFVAGIGSEGNAAFTIVGNELRAARTFSQAERQTYSIRVRTTDQGGLAIDRVHQITIGRSDAASRVASLSRVEGEGYARLVQGGIALDEGQTYRFSVRIAGNVALQGVDHLPEFWGEGLIFDGESRTATFRDGWTTYEAVVTTRKTGRYELKLALWSLQSISVTDISLRSVSTGAELVRNGRFQDGLAGWYTHGGMLSLGGADSIRNK